MLFTLFVYSSFFEGWSWFWFVFQNLNYCALYFHCWYFKLKSYFYWIIAIGDSFWVEWWRILITNEGDFKCQRKKVFTKCGNESFNENVFAWPFVCFLVLSSWENLAHMETSPFPVKGCKIRPFAPHLSFSSGRDLYRVIPAVTLFFFLRGGGIIRITVQMYRFWLVW